MTEKGCRKCYVPELEYVNDGTGDIGSASGASQRSRSSDKRRNSALILIFLLLIL
jgi:hypothetical protein